MEVKGEGETTWSVKTKKKSRIYAQSVAELLPGGVYKAVVPGRSFGSLTVCIAEQRGNYRHYNNYPQRDIPGRPVSRHSHAVHAQTR